VGRLRDGCGTAVGREEMGLGVSAVARGGGGG
jgi:hypothetical protein